MPTIRRFEEIEAWQTARELTRLVYSITEEGKFAKDFGLKDQIRRACVSIMSNIAEGFESKTQPAFIRYLGVAKASAGEVRAQSYVANDVKYLSDEQFAQLFDIAEKSSRQLSRFISYLEAQPNTYRVKDESPEYET